MFSGEHHVEMGVFGLDKENNKQVMKVIEVKPDLKKQLTAILDL